MLSVHRSFVSIPTNISCFAPACLFVVLRNSALCAPSTLTPNLIDEHNLDDNFHRETFEFSPLSLVFLKVPSHSLAALRSSMLFSTSRLALAGLLCAGHVHAAYSIATTGMLYILLALWNSCGL